MKRIVNSILNSYNDKDCTTVYDGFKGINVYLIELSCFGIHRCHHLYKAIFENVCLKSTLKNIYLKCLSRSINDSPIS